MKKIFAAIFLSVFCLSSFVLPENVSAQIANPAEDRPVIEQTRWLRGDLKVADVVAYVDVKERKLVDFIGNADCENDKGTGYCLYLLKAELKEVFKGRTEGRTIEFYVGPDASYPKKHLLGEKVVFLVRGENSKDKTSRLSTIENSTRGTEVVAAMRKIVDPKTPIDETDESEPYSLKSVKKDFAEAAAVVYADVTSFKPGAADSGSEPFVMKATIREVFKGDFAAGREIEYREDFLYRPVRREDLGRQVLYLEKTEEDGRIVYRRISYSFGEIKYDILKKLRKIKAKN